MIYFVKSHNKGSGAMKSVSVADLKAHLSDYLKATEQGPVVITRRGKPTAVLVAVADEDELERLLMAHSPRLQAILEAARKRIRAGKGVREEDCWAGVASEPEAPKRGARRGKSA
jgi:prevent-host-death family protein